MTNNGPTDAVESLDLHVNNPFRRLIDAVVDYAIIMLDPNGNVVSWNPGAEKTYGYRAEEIIGRHFSTFYTPEDVTSGKPERDLELVRSEGHLKKVCLRVRKDGSSFWAILSISELKGPDGKHAGFAKVTRDVSDRKQAETALRSERELSDAILSSLPGVFYMYDEKRRFRHWNRQFEIVTEYSAEEIKTLHPLDLFGGSDKALLERRIESVFRNGWDEVEAKFVTKSGKRIPYYFNGLRCEIDNKVYLLGMGIDITAHKRAQDALRSSDQHLRQAVNAANVGLWNWDFVTNEAYYSPEWKRQLGYEDAEVGNGFEEWEGRIHPEDIDGARERVRLFLANPSGRYDSEFRMRHRDGSYRCILAQASLIFDDQSMPIRMIGSHVDVTELRRLERQLQQSQKLEAIGQLAGGVAHDFNNLLTVINGYSEMLLGDIRHDDSMREPLFEIHRAGESAASLTRQLLAFSRQQDLEPKVINLKDVVLDIEKMLCRLIGENIILSISGSSGTVKADPGQIEQILINLAVNARDAMPNGGRLSIETHNVTLDESYCRGVADLQPGAYVMLAVSDTGHGMEEKTKARIFEPFFTTKGVTKGTGLGLATVHGIVKQSRGHVAVDSEIGHGTTFKIYLPRVYETAQAATCRAGAGMMPAGKETILLVEDEDLVRTLARHILRSCGYYVLEATNGKEALELSDGYFGAIQLLLSDVIMPQMGGKELAEQIVAKRPDCKVLYLSGYADDAVVRHGTLEAEYAFLQKPFAPSALAQKVRSVLNEGHP